MNIVKVIADREGGAELIKNAVLSELKRLEIALHKTDREIRLFEERYDISSAKFLDSISAEDLQGGDAEYVQWAGELQLRERIVQDITELKRIEYVHN